MRHQYEDAALSQVVPAPFMHGVELSTLSMNSGTNQNKHLLNSHRSSLEIKCEHTPIPSHVTGTHLNSSHSNIWIIPRNSIIQVPPFYPLEHTSKFIPGCASHSSVLVIARRISNVLSQRSVQATYNSKKAQAKCVTKDGVEFQLQLYVGKGNFSHGIIIEAQRRSGCCIKFQKYVTAVLEVNSEKKNAVLTGIKSEEEPVSTFALPNPNTLKYDRDLRPTFSRAMSSSQEQKIQPAEPASECHLYDTAESLLLHRNQYDANLLGFILLCWMTESKPATTFSSQIALAVSQKLLIKSEGVGVRKFILSLIQKNPCQQWHTEDGECEYLNNMRNHAIMALKNSLSIISQHDLISSLLVEQKDFIDHLIPALLFEMKMSCERPYEASLAVSCLEQLIHGCVGTIHRLTARKEGIHATHSYQALVRELQ